MASTEEFAQYVQEQLGLYHHISYRKMFGEYGIYCNGKIIGLVCDNQFFLKPTKAGAALLDDPLEAPPYEGAKPYFLLESLDNSQLIGQVLQATYDELPAPKPKKKKQHPNVT